MTVFIAAPGKRLGDGVVMLPALQAALASGLQIRFVARSPYQIELADLVPGLTWIAEPDFNKYILSGGDRYHDFFAHSAFQTYSFDTLKFNQSFAGANIDHLIALACRDFGLPPPLAHPQPLPFDRRNEFANCIVLVPGATSGSKRWPLNHWLDLYKQLSIYFLVVCIGEPEKSKAVKEVIEAGIAHLPTPTVRDALDAVSSCRSVISADTGLMHLAVHQGTPTIALFNQHSIWARPHASLKAIKAKACTRECHDTFLQAEKEWMSLQMESTATADSFVEFGKTWSGEDYLPCTDPHAAKCMASIEPSHVVSHVLSFGM